MLSRAPVFMAVKATTLSPLAVLLIPSLMKVVSVLTQSKLVVQSLAPQLLETVLLRLKVVPTPFPLLVQHLVHSFMPTPVMIQFTLAT